jgi:hypothetical protein
MTTTDYENLREREWDVDLEDLAELRESLQDVTAALTGLLVLLIKERPPSQQGMLRELYTLTADTGDRLRGVPAGRAIE